LLQRITISIFRRGWETRSESETASLRWSVRPMTTSGASGGVSEVVDDGTQSVTPVA
jgi:hypothetical protein